MTRHSSRVDILFLISHPTHTPFRPVTSHVLTFGRNVSATSDAVFFSGLRGAACFGLSPGTNEGSVAVVPGGAAGVSPSSGEAGVGGGAGGG